MAQRFLSIWFRHLMTDWLIRHRPSLRNLPFVFASPDHGRMRITAANRLATQQGIGVGMMVADARALVPSLQVFNNKPGRADKLLAALAAYCIRYTPVAAVDLPDGIILDISGCAQLWGGERTYITDIIKRIKSHGYQVRVAIADTIGTAWAVARFGQVTAIIESGAEADALLLLPAAALRLPLDILVKLQKLGLYQVGSFISMPRAALRRRFGKELILKLDEALGHEKEIIQPVEPVTQYHERLHCLEPIVTATAIEIALKQLLERLCHRLRKEEKGIRKALFKGYRVDGKIEEIEIATNSASHHISHLFKLFETNIPTIEPAMGIELFVLDAVETEDAPALQQNLWTGSCGLEHTALWELLDRIGNKMGQHTIHRYLPDEHYWPERCMKTAIALNEKSAFAWQLERPRPVQLLPHPEPIEVTAPVPDYPPMLFRYKNELHKIKKADGPERIEREWWIDEGAHRDYYCVEDEQGRRYWLFRSGHYNGATTLQWFIHGFFA